MTEQIAKSPVLDRRTQVDASQPLVQSEWKVEGGRVVGHLAWSSCVDQRTWTVEEQRVKRVRPIPTAAWLTFGAGVAFGVVAIASHRTEPTVRCTGAFAETCRLEEPDNTVSDLNLVGAVLGISTGLVLMAIKPSDQVTVLKHEPHAETTVGPCVAPEELSDMSLLLKLGPNRFVHVTVGPDGEAAADLSPGARLPRGVDLPIVVYRAPPALAKTLPRWQVVGQVHVPD